MVGILIIRGSIWFDESNQWIRLSTRITVYVINTSLINPENLQLYHLVTVFSLFHNYLPLDKGLALYLNKLESLSPKDALCQVWLKLAQRFCGRFRSFVNVFSLFRNYLPLEKDGTFEHFSIPFTQECFVPSLVEIGLAVLERIFKFRQCIFAIS